MDHKTEYDRGYRDGHERGYANDLSGVSILSEHRSQSYVAGYIVGMAAGHATREYDKRIVAWHNRERTYGN